MKSSMQNKYMYLEGYLPNSLQGHKEKVIKLYSAAGTAVHRYPEAALRSNNHKMQFSIHIVSTHSHKTN